MFYRWPRLKILDPIPMPTGHFCWWITYPVCVLQTVLSIKIITVQNKGIQTKWVKFLLPMLLHSGYQKEDCFGISFQKTHSK
jgi:hypothetical protein